MGVAPAGVEKPNTGHHHLLIDSTLSGDELKQPIPMDDSHRHFGNGQTEAMITLPPGSHKLQLVLGDWSHIPQAPPVMSDVITVPVR
jgi:glutaredoxin-related protein